MNKYNISSKQNRTVSGITFDSKKEMNRYNELILLEKSGKISGLKLQPSFLLQESFVDNTGTKHREIKYFADFEYYENGNKIIEDVKGFRKIPTFIIKKKLLLYKYKDFEFREI
jgi:hypothetical protein